MPAPADDAGSAVGQELSDKDREIVAWVEDVLRQGSNGDTKPAAASIAVSLEDASGPAAKPTASRGARVILLSLGPVPPNQTRRATTFQFQVRYLISTWAETVATAHQMLADLVFAAMADASFEVELTPPSAETWKALGLNAQPAFLLQTTVWRSKVLPVAKRVLHPMVPNVVPSAAVRGRLVGPGDLPIAGAMIQLPSIAKSTETDAGGYFSFPMVPAQPKSLVFVVRAKGETQTLTGERRDDDQVPIQLHFQLKED